MKKLTPSQTKLLKTIEKDKTEQLKEYEDYSGYPIPKHHPDNELSSKQAKDFSQQSLIAHSLVKLKLLRLIQDDRRIEVFAPAKEKLSK
ncbi:MAG: hypothetical protein KF802_02400 [Bdellovibrionaceae bacterium]|nr:hypothetical protein [Pseudobdellovibrionaceae bacterium]